MIKDLQKATHNAVSAETNQEKIESLHRAFEIFSYETVRLENAYDSLNEQFQSLNLELQDTNHTLQSKVAELDIITDYLKNILDNIVQGILFIDLNGTITTCNRAAETILGIKSSEVIFRRFSDLFRDDTFGFSMQTALEREQESATYFVSYSSPANHHSELEVVTTYALKNNKDGSCHNQGMIIMIRDVTEMRELQVMAARADRLKILGEMAAQVAHEIRNPLGGIKGFASLLKRDLTDNPDMQKMASYIVEGTDSLNNLVNQILHYARPILPHLEKADLIALLQQVKQHILADTNIYKPHIDILIDSPLDEMILSMDASHLKSAILNLLVNAIQAIPEEGGTISLNVHKARGYAILSVSDTGAGIAEENIPKLYSPFFTTKPEGNGFGLVEVQKVVQAHGGTIDVSSILGKGTTFTIKLPLKYSL